MNEIQIGLEENELCHESFLEFGYSKLRLKSGDFYPAVGTFIHACMPEQSKYKLPTPQNAFDQVSKVANSHFKSKLEPLVYMAAKGHWAALGEGKGFKEFCRRYEEIFQKWARGQIEKENPPIPIESPKPKPMSETEKEDAHNLIQGLIKGIENE